MERLARMLGEGVRRNEPLAPYTSIRVGGEADLLLVCRSADELARAVRLARQLEVPVRVLGDGSNVLIADAGVRGLVLINRANRVHFAANGTVEAEAGTRMAVLARQAAGLGLKGLEWAAGLPGTVGGAVVGNAGAFGGEIAASLHHATLLDPQGRVVEREVDWFEYGYRQSRLKRERGGYVVLAATFALEYGEPEWLAERLRQVLEERQARQPAGLSLGSTFKNPPEGSAGLLIDRAGLKGYQLGGVRVSEKHANFFVNVGGASAADVMALLRHVQREVEAREGVRLEPEIEFVGEW